MAVYLKKLDDMFADSAAGAGWFKIWDSGYDAETGKWAVDTLIDNSGLVSVNLPDGVPPGYYLVRTELLALHFAYRGDPQYYVDCAQIFITDGVDGELEIPADREISIPGYLDEERDMGLSFSIYSDDGEDYIIPGPETYFPTTTDSTPVTTREQKDGVIPADCLIQNANWCAHQVPSFTDTDSCWDSVDDCYDQQKVCWDTLPPTGWKNCPVWHDYCLQLEKICQGDDSFGPPIVELVSAYPEAPMDLPAARAVKGTVVKATVSVAAVEEEFSDKLVDFEEAVSEDLEMDSILEPESESELEPAPASKDEDTQVIAETEETGKEESPAEPEPEPEPEPEAEAKPTPESAGCGKVHTHKRRKRSHRVRRGVA